MPPHPPHHDHHHDHDHHHHHHHHHPPHHHEKYHEWHWGDLPQHAVKAAECLGYDKETWDSDGKVEYDEKPFGECTLEEKQAALLLGMKPLDDKLDIWWEETDDETKENAEILGFDQHKWDDDWDIDDLECEKWWWKDMTPEQKRAARFFGYSRNTWDEKEYDDDYVSDVDEEGSKEENQAPLPDSEVVDEEPPAEAEEANVEQAETPPAAATYDPEAYSETELFGGTGGGEFDDGTHKRVVAITVQSGTLVDAINVTYGGDNIHHGGEGGGKSKLFMRKPEHINQITVLANRKEVVCLTFKTNKGRTLGPCGGSGGMFGRAEETVLNAPDGCMLVGFKGRCGDRLDAIGFHWGPINT